MDRRTFSLAFDETELGTLLLALNLTRADYEARAADEAARGVPHWQAAGMAARLGSLVTRAYAAADALADFATIEKEAGQ